MREKLIAGNWKMANGPKEATDYILRFAELFFQTTSVIKAQKDEKIKIAIFPPSISLSNINHEKVKTGLPIILGGQNMHWEKKGAYTGEISAQMLKEAGCSHVIIGHSERRTLFNETNIFLNKKISAALEEDLTTVFCLGEHLEEKESQKTHEVIRKQFLEGLNEIKIDQFSKKIIIAYEPIWAIGSGITATSSDAQNVCSFIRELISESFGEKEASKSVILYGGSVKTNNTESFLTEKDIDGVLVGGASIDPNSFFDIVKKAVKS
mgnify:FL=1